MVGWGGFGAANAGAAIMVRAAAKEPAIVALANAFLEFIAIILSRGLSDVVSDGANTAYAIGLPENPAAGFKPTPMQVLRASCFSDYGPLRHDSVTGIALCNIHWVQILGMQIGAEQHAHALSRRYG